MYYKEVDLILRYRDCRRQIFTSLLLVTESTFDGIRSKFV